MPMLAGYFDLDAHGTAVRTGLIAGLTTFFDDILHRVRQPADPVRGGHGSRRRVRRDLPRRRRVARHGAPGALNRSAWPSGIIFVILTATRRAAGPAWAEPEKIVNRRRCRGTGAAAEPSADS